MNFELRLPEKDDFLRYAEGVPLDPLVERKIQTLLASNSQIRQCLAELRKDFYRIETQIPNFPLPVETAIEIAHLAQAWARSSPNTRRSPKNAQRGRVLWLFIGWLCVALLGMVFWFRAL